MVDVLFCGRKQRSAKTFGSASKNTKTKESLVSVSGKLVSMVDDGERQLKVLTCTFSPEVSRKIFDGTIVFPKQVTLIADDEIFASLVAKEKRRLKTVTKVSRRHE